MLRFTSYKGLKLPMLLLQTLKILGLFIACLYERRRESVVLLGKFFITLFWLAGVRLLRHFIFARNSCLRHVLSSTEETDIFVTDLRDHTLKFHRTDSQLV